MSSDFRWMNSPLRAEEVITRQTEVLQLHPQPGPRSVYCLHKIQRTNPNWSQICGKPPDRSKQTSVPVWGDDTCPLQHVRLSGAWGVISLCCYHSGEERGAGPTGSASQHAASLRIDSDHLYWFGRDRFRPGPPEAPSCWSQLSSLDFCLKVRKQQNTSIITTESFKGR